MFPFLSQSRPTLTEPDAALVALSRALRQDVEVLATDIGPRGTHAPHRYALARDFLFAALRSAGYTVESHDFEADGVACSNLIATLPGNRTPDRVLVVGAHYDTVEGCPAANDNSSGVAGVLALAREFADRPQPCTIRFVLFANEEPPFFNLGEMGSQIYARACRERGDDVRGMVCLETIGCYSSAPGSQRWPHDALGLLLPRVGDFIAMVGPSSARAFIKDAAGAFEAQRAFPLVAAAAPEMIDQINWSDHRGFNEVGYAAFMLTDTAPFRYDHYHQPTDTAEKLDYVSMARVIRGTAGMVRELANSSANST